MSKDFYVYILTNASRSTLYVGVTSDLQRRLHEHKHGLVEGFTEQYRIDRLVYCEHVKSDGMAAIRREKQLKTWNRAWKERLIEKENPEWRDLSEDWFGESNT